jgi:hypothetical protein
LPLRVPGVDDFAAADQVHVCALARRGR